MIIYAYITIDPILIRPSLREVEYVARMLQTADPPLSVSVFDSKKGEVINI